jgi:hypothetical protein
MSTTYQITPLGICMVRYVRFSVHFLPHLPDEDSNDSVGGFSDSDDPPEFSDSIFHWSSYLTRNPRAMTMVAGLPKEIGDSLHHLPDSVSSECRFRALELLVLVPSHVKNVSIFDDDGDITFAWCDLAVFCDVRKDPESADHVYRLNKVDKTVEGKFVSNVFFAKTPAEAQSWLDGLFSA